jgi:hypothetical protein
MKMGTKSLLIGVHQIFIHPIIVYLAWRKLYDAGPTWKESICIIVHDWGYWGTPNMDGPEGENHPELGARIVNKLFGEEYRDFCLYHSRTYAAKHGKEPSLLCWPDKISLLYEINFFYILRATLSGEIKEYRKHAADFDSIPLSQPDSEWFSWARERMIKKAYARDVRPAYEEGS